MHATTNIFKTFVLLAALGGLMVAIGSLFGRGGALIGLTLGLGIVGFSYWKSDSLAIRAARAVPAVEAEMPEYYRIVRELATQAGTLPDRVPRRHHGDVGGGADGLVVAAGPAPVRQNSDAAA